MTYKIDKVWSDPEFLAKMINTMPGYAYCKDRNGVIVHCNDSIVTLLNYDSPDQIIGKTDHDFGFEPEVLAKILRQDAAVLQQGETVIDEDAVVLNQKLRYFQTEKRPLYFDGAIVGILGVSVDITAEKMATEHLMHALKVTAAHISHEMKTPLAGIKTSLELIQKLVAKLNIGYQQAEQADLIEKTEGKSIYDKLTHYMAQISQRIDSATTMISMQLKNMSIDTIDSRFFSKLSIGKIIAAAIKTYPFTEEEKLLIHCDSDKDFIFLGEQSLTINILWNLFNNSLHAIRDAGKGNIKIWIESDSAWHYLHIKDTAKGMTSSIVAQAFDKFFSNRRDGCGLGLAFCQKVIRAYGGDITCSAKEGEYTYFTLKFPVC